MELLVKTVYNVTISIFLLCKYMQYMQVCFIFFNIPNNMPKVTDIYYMFTFNLNVSVDVSVSWRERLGLGRLETCFSNVSVSSCNVSFTSLLPCQAIASRCNSNTRFNVTDQTDSLGKRQPTRLTKQNQYSAIQQVGGLPILPRQVNLSISRELLPLAEYDW